MDLAQDAGLVGGQIDDAVRDDHVDGRVWKGNVLDLALEELHIGDAGFLCIPSCKLEHLVGHVDPVGEPGRANALGGQQDVDATA